MAKIQEMDGNPKSNYQYLFGDADLGLLMSRVQAAIISAGTELERYINELVPSERKTDLESAILSIRNGLIGSEIEIIYKPKKPRIGRQKEIQSDFAILFHRLREVYVIELKYGTHFDTQKAPAAREGLESILNYICNQTGYAGKFFICSFHEIDPKEIVIGLKGAFEEKEVMTGLEFCKHLGIEFEDVMEKIVSDQPENLNYFISETDKVKAKNQIRPDKYFERKRRLAWRQLRYHWIGDQDV